MIPLAQPNLTGDEEKFLKDCIISGYVSSAGPFVKKFEKQLSILSGGKNVVSTSSGTSALHLSLKALGIGHNDLVITPAYSFIASANAISMAGASPWFFDIDNLSWTLDCNLLEKELNKKTFWKEKNLYHKQTGQKVKGIMPVNTLGIPCDLDSIYYLSEKYNLRVIIDGAASLGAKYKSFNIAEKVQSLITFSFNGNKTITSGGGGAVVGNDKTLMEKLREMSGTGKKYNSTYTHDVIGFNHRMTNVEAAIGCAQLARTKEFVYRKNEILKNYNNALKSIEGVTFIPEPNWGESSSWMSGIILDKKLIPDIKNFLNYLFKNKIDAKMFWKPLCEQKPYINDLKTNISVTKKVSESFIALPCSTSLSHDEQSFIIEKIKEFF